MDASKIINAIANRSAARIATSDKEFAFLLVENEQLKTENEQLKTEIEKLKEESAE